MAGAGSGVDFSTAWINVGRGPTDAKVRDLEKLALVADVIVGGEFGDREAVVERFLRRNRSWRVLWNKREHATRSVPILYNRKTLRLKKWAYFLVRIGYLGPKGAGSNSLRWKVINSARFIHRGSGQSVRVVGTHLIASAFSTSGAEGSRRKAAFRRQVGKYFDLIKSWKRAVVCGVGDFNAEVGNELLDNASSKVAGWVWVRTGPTMGRRRIDLFGYRRDKRVLGARAYTVETDGSKNFEDHRAVVGVLTLRTKFWKRK